MEADIVKVVGIYGVLILSSMAAPEGRRFQAILGLIVFLGILFLPRLTSG